MQSLGNPGMPSNRLPERCPAIVRGDRSNCATYSGTDYGTDEGYHSIIPNIKHVVIAKGMSPNRSGADR